MVYGRELGVWRLDVTNRQHLKPLIGPEVPVIPGLLAIPCVAFLLSLRRVQPREISEISKAQILKPKSALYLKMSEDISDSKNS